REVGGDTHPRGMVTPSQEGQNPAYRPSDIIFLNPSGLRIASAATATSPLCAARKGEAGLWSPGGMPGSRCRDDRAVANADPRAIPALLSLPRRRNIFPAYCRTAS